MKFFNIDGPFQKYGTIIFDIVVMSALWFLLTFFSLGILSGPALTGIYSGVYSGIISGEGYTFKDFFRRFKKRFVISLLFGLLNLLFIVMSLGNIYMVLMNVFGSTWLLPIYLFVLLEVAFIGTYAYPLLAHTQLKFKELIKTSFFLANKHLPTTILSAILNSMLFFLVVIVLLGYLQYSIYLFAIPGVIVAINSNLITKKILTQYDFFLQPEH